MTQSFRIFAYSIAAACILLIISFEESKSFLCAYEASAARLQADKDGSTSAKGPLTILKSNPRYFTDGSGKVVYLTGSHTWNNLQDMGFGDPPPAFDFDAYLDFLQRYRHNFIRLWRWESIAWNLKASAGVTNQTGVLTVATHPWKRSGPGKALDGKAKFDLAKFDETYFQRLRSRVQAAGQRGIYVSVMLFEGWDFQHSDQSAKAHPFHKDNNVNGVNGDPNGDGHAVETHTLKDAAITRLQEAYVRKVIDTIGDLDNILYEIANESGAYSIKWQYHMIRFIKEYEKKKPKRHPVGMTFPYSRDPKQRGSNLLLFDSPADWISPNPNAGDGYNYRSNPPPNDGKKVILSDTDHLWGIGGNVDWAWKSFLRGHNPLFMDPYDNRVLGKGKPEQWNALRANLGQTRRFAERIDLAHMTPSSDIAATKYCLANPGHEYLVYQPGKGKFTVDLRKAPGDFAVEWFTPPTDKTTKVGNVKGGEIRTFAPPTAMPAVLYLKRKPAAALQVPKTKRLRLIVETDAGGDPDDEQSLVRFLLYANEWDVEGIIANRPAARQRENRNPERTGIGIVRRLLKAYGECYPNLVKHDNRYPKPETLLRRTVAGYEDKEDGENLIIAAVDADDPRPIWFLNWGTDRGSASSCLKRALDRVRKERGPKGYTAFKSKLRLSSADRFAEHTTDIEPPFPLWVDTLRPPLDGKRWYHRFSALTAKAGGFDLKRDVLNNHGPLGALYPTNTTHAQKEGDTMTFLYLVPTGMNDPEQPTWGSWAGRYGRNPSFKKQPYYWANQADTWQGTSHRDNTLKRWAADLQNDFRTRLNWCVAPYQKANHPPLVLINGQGGNDILYRNVSAGSTLLLDAAASSDPDGDELGYEWFVYPEAGTYAGAVTIANGDTAKVRVMVPNDATGKSVHVVLKVRDRGKPPLARYRRVVLNCTAMPSK